MRSYCKAFSLIDFDLKIPYDFRGPGFAQGAVRLVLQRDRSGLPIHVMWGVPKISGTPAVLVTASTNTGTLVA
jgi:hypothetical protein